MGNAASNPQRPAPAAPSSGRRKEPPSPQSSRQAPHPSLRTKKKSLELPDLASLAITPANHSITSSTYGSGGGSSGGARGRPQQISSPIAIPVSPNVNSTNRRRPQNNFSSTQNIGDDNDDLVQHHTHIPIPPRNGNDSTSTNNTRRTRGRQPRGADKNNKERDRDHHRKQPQAAVQEVVYSTIPIALGKAAEAAIVEQDTFTNALDGLNGMVAGTSIPGRKSTSDEAVNVKISWNGGGNSVLLARAGDDDWKGRQIMERESETSNTFSTQVLLFPGTHHIKFVVDDVWRVADDLPQAVDDQGSLANYVNVASSTPPSLSIPSTPPRTQPTSPLQLQGPGHSFWSTSSSTDDPPSQYVPQYYPPPLPTWTTEYPLELIEAAREEETYLASTHAHGGSSGAPEPNIPPAPGLPRHLEKLILNVRSPGVVVPRNNGGRSPSAGGSRREKDRTGTIGRRGGGAVGRSALGMTSTTAAEAGQGGEAGPSIPVTTASGTDVTRTLNGATSSGVLEERDREREREKERERPMLDGPAIADDSSMLPVPSHVVLHHLSTSAIKNGVLAVGNTTRYRKKYLTTIYYKPT